MRLIRKRVLSSWQTSLAVSQSFKFTDSRVFKINVVSIIADVLIFIDFLLNFRPYFPVANVRTTIVARVWGRTPAFVVVEKMVGAVFIVHRFANNYLSIRVVFYIRINFGYRKVSHTYKYRNITCYVQKY